MSKIYRKDNKVVGNVKNFIFTKVVSESKHMLRKWGGCWGMDKEILEQLKEMNVQEIRIREKEKHIEYFIGLNDFITRGMAWDFGHGEQIFLNLVEFGKRSY